MKIAYCIGALNLGGIGTVANNLSQYFLQRGDEFKIVTTHHKGNFFDTAKELNWPVLDISESEISLKKRMRKTYNFLVDYDVVINNHSDELLFVLPALPNSIIKLSVQHNTTIKSSKRLSFNSQYLNFSAGVSPAVTNMMRKYHSVKDNIVVLPNGVSKVTTKEYTDEESSPLKLLFAGRIDNIQKNIFILPKILKNLHDRGLNVFITIAGSGEHEKQLQAKFEELSLDGKYEFVGRVSKDHLGLLFRTHDFLLNPSNWEGLPMIVLEAMSAGIIPILSSIEPHKYALGDDIFSEIIPSNDDVEDYCDMIYMLNKDPRKRNLISVKLIERWKSNFSIEAFGDNYLNLIEISKNRKSSMNTVSLSNLKLPLKDRYKTTLGYYFVQKILRKTK